MADTNATQTQSEVDAAAGIELTDEFERYQQRNEMFNRSSWDPIVRTEKAMQFFQSYGGPLGKWKKSEGYTHKDYAIRNASWHVSDLFAAYKADEDRNEGFTNEFSVLSDPAIEPMPVESPEAMSAEIKHVAKLFGAGAVGIADYDERWVYSHSYSRQTDTDTPIEMPEGITHAIVIAVEMDYDLMQTAPSVLGSTSTGFGYSSDTVTLLTLGEYIRHLGYQAVVCLNDTAISIPLAIEAGLGEYGRMGLLITKEFGPRHRLGKIFTDMPLTSDKPIHFGVKEFCEICHLCAKACPSKAISDVEPSAEQVNMSTIKGVKKWSIDGEACFQTWGNLNSDCSICVRVCPYNQDYTHWWHRAARWLAGTPLRKLVLMADQWFGYGKRVPPGNWWADAQ